MREKSMDQKLQDFLDGDLEPELCEELVAKMKEDPALFHSYCKHAALDAALESLITQPATKRGGQVVELPKLGQSEC